MQKGFLEYTPAPDKSVGVFFPYENSLEKLMDIFNVLEIQFSRMEEEHEE